MNQSLQTQENIEESFVKKNKRVFFEEESENSKLILSKLKSEFSVSKSVMQSNSAESASIASTKEEKNLYDEVNKKAEEFTKWFLNDYLESIKNISN